MSPCVRRRRRTSVIRLWLGAYLVTIAQLGCAATDMHGFLDPDFRGHQFHKLVVSVQVEQLDRRDVAESAFTKSMTATGVSCVRALDVLPPTRRFDDKQLREAILQAGADGLLIVKQTDFYMDETYVPRSSTTNTYGTLNANTYYQQNQANTYGTLNSTSHTRTSGGYTIRKPRVRHEVRLWDVATGKLAWVGGTFTRGNAYARQGHLISSLALETGRALERHGLIAARSSSEEAQLRN